MKTSSADVPYAKIPAPPFERCARCGEMNGDKAPRLFRVKDERGPHIECDVCSFSSPLSADFLLP